MSKKDTAITWEGHDAYRALLVPVESLTMLDPNPNVGDVAAVARSYAHWGQRKPIVTRTDGTITAGNTQYKAALQLGWSHIAAIAYDEPLEESLAFALADNRTADLGDEDQAALDTILAMLDPVLIEDAGYTLADFDEAAVAVEERHLNAGRDLSIDEKLAAYQEKGVRHLILDFDLQTFGWVVDMAAELRSAMGAETNSQLICLLLEQATGVAPPEKQ